MESNVHICILVDCATVSNGDSGYCSCSTCFENEGHCDSDDECQDGLFCGSNNCPASLGFDSEVDCCYKPIELMSPNYPNAYPSNAEETWLLTATNGSFITLQFHAFYVRLIYNRKIELNMNSDFFLFHRPKHLIHIVVAHCIIMIL